MNKKDIEVELKFKIKDLKKLVDWLDRNAKLEHESHQIDDYYTPAHRNFFDKKHPNEYLRVRKSGDNWAVAYKFWHATEVEGEYSYCDEFETEVEDGKQIKKIFEALDFKYLLTVDKKRTSYRYKNFEIEVDVVKEVGTICEIEIQGDFESFDEARSQIKEFAKRLGFGEEDRGEDLKMGYVYMIAKKKKMI